LDVDGLIFEDLWDSQAQRLIIGVTKSKFFLNFRW
jgi:hypothetical protein